MHFRYENKVVKQITKLKKMWSLTVNEKEDEGENMSEETEKALTAYAKYMFAVFEVLLKSVEPEIDVEKNVEQITDAVKASLTMSRKLYKVL